jgi:glyoxylase-like metal-dependent hydrolase (beta-lactamase superfamily II)
MHPISRRSFLGSAALVAGAGLTRSNSLFAQQAALPAVVVQGRAAGATAKINTQSLRGNVSVLSGSGGNIAVLPGKEGTLLVDAGYSTSKPQILEALKSLNADSLSLLINTHWHFDHTDGNEWIHANGATILATSNTRARLSAPQDIAAFQAHFPASPAGAIPTKTFSSKQKLTYNGESLLLEAYAPAHTDTDTWVYFTHADVLHAGDTWFNGGYPFIDYSTGGSIDGMIKASEKSLALATDKTIIIPGHGPVGTRAQLQDFHHVLASSRAAVAEHKKQGKSLADTIAANPTAATDAKWGQGFVNPATFVTLIYQGV